MRRRVDKLLAKLALEAITETWKHYQAWSGRLEQSGDARPSELMDQYVRVRRLRDYMDNIVAQPGTVVIELDDDDANLFTSCMFFDAEQVERALMDPELEPQYERWYMEKLRNLCDLAQAFACAEVRLIGGREPGGPLPSHCQSVVEAIHSRLESQRSAQQTSRIGKAVGGAKAPTEAHEPASGIIKGNDYGTDFAQRNWEGRRNPLPRRRTLDPEPDAGSEFEATYVRPHRKPKSQPGYGRRGGRSLSEAQPEFSDEPAGPGQPAEPGPGLAGGAPKLPDASTPNVTRGSSLIKLELGLVRDPRLRGMLTLDLPAMDRAYAVQDFRTVALHLSSIFEALTLDIALQRRSALKLSGTPDSWRLQQVVPKLLTGKFTGPDRTSLHGLVQAKHLIRPAVQLTNPMPVTRQAVEKMLEFVRRLVRECGLSGV